MLDSAGNGDVRVCPLERRIHSAFRTSALGFVMLALIVFHGAVFGSNIMDPSSSFNPKIKQFYHCLKKLLRCRN